MKTTLTCLTLATITTVTAPARGQLRYSVPDEYRDYGYRPVHQVHGGGLIPYTAPGPQPVFWVEDNVADSYEMPLIERTRQFVNSLGQAEDGVLRASYSAALSSSRADFSGSSFIQHRAATVPLREQYSWVSSHTLVQVVVDHRVEVSLSFQEAFGGDSTSLRSVGLRLFDPENGDLDVRVTFNGPYASFYIPETVVLLPGVKYGLSVFGWINHSKPAGPFPPGQTEYTSWTSMDWSLSLVVVPSPGSVAILAGAVVVSQGRRRR